MNTFENTIPTQETAHKDTVIETAQSMREIDKLEVDTEKSLATLTEYLDNQDTPLDTEKIGLLHSIGEKFKKSHLLKAAALGVTLISAQPAFAQNGSIHLQDFDNSQQSNVNSSKLPKMQLQNIGQLRTPGFERGKLNVNASDFNNPNRIRIHDIGQLRTPGLRQGQLSINGQNILPGQISHFNQKTLPNATLNGGPAYEIAPGIYGDKNTVYRQTSDGGTVLMGGISIE